MTGYINWKAMTMPIKGDVLQMEGNNVADTDTVASAGTATAPLGAQYASVWCDVASTLEADVISLNGSPEGEPIYNAKTFIVPANTMVHIPNIVAGTTTITVTDL